MPCCCIKTLNLCNVPVCGVLELDVTATAPESPDANNYTLKLDFLNTQLVLTQEQTEGEAVSFDVSMLNENFQYVGQVFDSSGTLVTIENDAETYDCIKFKTIMNVTVY